MMGVFSTVGSLKANSEMRPHGFENEHQALSTCQGEWLQTSTQLARAGTGGPFLIDFFEPFLAFDAALDALNQMIETFNAHYPATLVHRKNDAKGVFTPLFKRIEKNETIPLFKVTKIMREYVDPKYPHESTAHLWKLYEGVLQEEGFVADDLTATLEDAATQVGYGWHLQDGIYREGLSENEKGTVYAPGCTMRAEETLDPVLRAFFLTEDIQRIAGVATVLQSMMTSLAHEERTTLRDLFIPIEDEDPDRVRLFDYEGSTYKLRKGVSMNIVSSLNEQEGSTAQRLEGIQATLSDILVRIKRIYKFSQ